MKRAFVTITAIAALTFAAAPQIASAEDPATDTAPACADGYVASGPYCVNPLYLNNPLFVDPTTCTNGYYQGSCVPDTLPAPVVHPADEYTYQPTAPAAVTAPIVGRRPICDPATNLCQCLPELGCTPCLPELGCTRLSGDELGLAFTRSVR
jgi:hypothetical protein